MDGVETVKGQLGYSARGVRWYLTERFPLGSQGAIVLVTYVCCYLGYGKMAGHGVVFDLAVVVGAVVFVLLFLERRIIDDIEDRQDDLAARGPTHSAGQNGRWSALHLGAMAVVCLIALLNVVGGDGTLLLISVAIVTWFPIATLIKHAVWGSRLLCFFVNESCPVAILGYAYVVYRDSNGYELPTQGVVSVILLAWTAYQFWNFTRKMGGRGWPPWGLGLVGTRRALLAQLGLAIVASLGVAHYARLADVYVIYGVVVPLVFATIILRWWSNLPDSPPEGTSVWWGGLLFPATVVVGVVLGMLS